MKMRSLIGLALLGALVLCVAFSGCGKKANPLTPGTTSGPTSVGVGLPHVTSVVSSANGGAQLSNADQIIIVFDRPMNPSTINTSTITVTGYGTGESGAKPGTVSYRASQNRAVFVPASNFANTTGYLVTVAIGAQDLKGNPIDGNGNNVAEAFNYDNSRWGVYTAGGAGNLPDMVPPTVYSWSPTHNSNATNLPITVIFTTNDLDWTTLTTSAFAVYDANGNVVGTGALTVDSVNVLGIWRTRAAYNTVNLAAGTVYTVKLSSAAVKDKSGNTLDGNGNGVAESGTFDDVSWQFITQPTSGDAAPPSFSGSSISSDGLVLTVKFNETMNTSLFTVANVKVFTDTTKTQYVTGTIIPTLDGMGFTYSLENAPQTGNLYLWVSRNVTNSTTGFKLDSNGNGVGGEEAIPSNHFGGPKASDDLWHQVR